MTWTINVSGHVDSPEEEQQVKEAVQSLLDDLPGTVFSAIFSGMHSGTNNLLHRPGPSTQDDVAPGTGPGLGGGGGQSPGNPPPGGG